MQGEDELQGELDFSGDNPSGHARWQQEQADWLSRLRKEIGLPIGRQVRVKLRDLDREFSGRLTLVELPLDSHNLRHQQFRVGTFEFTAAEIEFCVRED